MGAEDVADLEETPPSLAEGWRICTEVRSVKRIWMSLPFLAIALIGLGSLTNIYYEDTFGLSELVVNQGSHSEARSTSAAAMPSSSPGDTLDKSR